MCKLPEGFRISDAEREKLLLAYQHLDERIKRAKLTYNDAPVLAERVHDETGGNRLTSIERKAS